MSCQLSLSPGAERTLYAKERTLYDYLWYGKLDDLSFTSFLSALLLFSAVLLIIVTFADGNGQ